MLKDVSLFGEMAASLEVPAFISQEVVELWRLVASRGLGPKDFTNIVRVMEEWARVEIDPSIR